MTIAERVRQINATADGAACRNLVNGLRSGRFRLGPTPVHFNYTDMADFFHRCDPSIDAQRFEYLMQIADEAEAGLPPSRPRFWPRRLVRS